jgi:hypothetical protein
MRMPAVSIRRNAFAMALLLLGAFLSVPSAMEAQSAGNNAVYQGSPATLTASSAFIDASVLSGSDVCAQISTALGIISLTSLPGAVIDARGVTNLATPCSASPWVSYTPPSVILLPAGTITIPGTWVVPAHTKLIGEGMRESGTTITPSGSISPMIQFCSSACAGVSIEGVFLNAAGYGVTELENKYADDGLSYVDHVNLSNFGTSGTGLGLKVDSTASGSGAYSNLSCGPMSTGSSCVEILASNTGGLHGITCTAASATVAAILLDGSNNTLEDVHIEGFYDGILVGSNASAQSNVLSNVNGTGGGAAGPIQNVIHVSNSNTVSDLTILAASSLSETYTVTNLLKDDVTVTTIPNGTGTPADAALAEYALGTDVGLGLTPPAYSRFSTNVTVTPTLAVGSTALSTGTTCADVGSLYVNTTGTHGLNNTLWVCVGGSPPTWKN